MRHEDNLRLEGQFEGRKQQQQVLVGERASVVRHSDNLKMEGSFHGLKSEMHEAHTAARGERVEVKRRQDNLKMEGR